MGGEQKYKQYRHTVDVLNIGLNAFLDRSHNVKFFSKGYRVVVYLLNGNSHYITNYWKQKVDLAFLCLLTYIICFCKQ